MASAIFMTRPGPLPRSVPDAPGYRIGPATPSDRPALSRLLVDAFDDTWDEDRVDRELLANPAVARTWLVRALADNDDEILATSSELLNPERYGDAGCVHWVASSTRARGRGLGTLAVLATLAGFAERGLASAVLNTDDGRPAAVRVYLQLGFVPASRNDEETLAWSTLLPLVLAGRPGTPTSTQAPAT